MSDATGSTSATPDLPTDPEALEAAIVARRAHLAGTLDELAERVKPANLAADAKQEAVTRVRATFTDKDGELLYERIAAIAAAVVAVVTVVIVAKVRTRR